MFARPPCRFLPVRPSRGVASAIVIRPRSGRSLLTASPPRKEKVRPDHLSDARDLPRAAEVLAQRGPPAEPASGALAPTRPKRGQLSAKVVGVWSDLGSRRSFPWWTDGREQAPRA